MQLSLSIDGMLANCPGDLQLRFEHALQAPLYPRDRRKVRSHLGMRLQLTSTGTRAGDAVSIHSAIGANDRQMTRLRLTREGVRSQGERGHFGVATSRLRIPMPL